MLEKWSKTVKHQMDVRTYVGQEEALFVQL